MTFLQLKTGFEGAGWKRAYAEASIRRTADINPDAADEFADAQHLLHSHHSPECSAAEYAQHQRSRGIGGDLQHAARTDYDSTTP